MIKLRVLDGPNECHEHRCAVEETDKDHKYLFGNILVDFTINNPDVKITRGDIIVLDGATVYTVIARKIISLEHSKA